MNRVGEERMHPIRKFNYYLIFSLAELLLLLFFSMSVLSKGSFTYDFQNISTDRSDAAVKICTERIGVPKGICTVTVQYEKGRGNGLCYAQASEKGVHSLYTDHVKLSYLQSEKSFDIYVNDDVDDLQLVIEPEADGDFAVNRLHIEMAANSKIYQIFCLAVKLLLINGIVALIYYRNRRFKRCTEIIGIFVIGMIASAGLMEEYILYGHDLMFHLLRIEGLKDGLLAGGYPVRLQPGWFNGWGYPVSIMYGDQLLYFPALLRLVGVNLQNAYKCYIGAVNLGTAAVAYYAFLKIAKDKNAALFGSCLYTLSPYRLSCIYVRAALGEYSAMLFLPLVLLCFWYAFEAKEDEKITADKLAAPIVGFTGLIQTHILSCFLTAFIIVIFCIIYFKRIFRKNVLIYLCQTAFITILVNLWFIVPFFQYMGEPFVVTAKAQMTPAFQRWGANFAELFAVYWNGTLNSAWGEIASISQKFPKPVGTAYLMILVIAVCMYAKGRAKRLEKKMFLCISFFLLSVFMASTAFPYYAINKIFPALGSLFLHIQFPYRFLTLTGLFGSILAVFVIMEITGTWGKRAAAAVAALVGLVAALQGSQLIYSTMYRGDCLLVYDIAALDNNAVSTGEYLYEGTYGPNTEGQQIPVGEGAVIESFEKRYNEITLTCKSEREDAYILMPLFYYIGYEARDLTTNKTLEIVRSEDNNRIRVNLPAGYEGTFQVHFNELPAWRAAKLVSLLTILYILFKWIKKKKGSICGKDIFHKMKTGIKRGLGGFGNSAFFWNLVVTGIVFGILLILNFHADYTSDDFKYHFFFDTMGTPHEATHRMRIWEVFSSMANHWKMCNGRIVAHGMLQLALMLGKTGFKILNSFMFILLGTLIYLHASYGKKKSTMLLIFIYVCLWFFIPQFGMTVIWASGAANYLWNTVLILAFVLPYRVYLMNQKAMEDRVRNLAIMGILGIFAGCSNENSGGAMVLLCLMYIFLYRYHKIPVPKWGFSGIAGGIMGIILLISAPGNYRISSKTDLAGLMERGKRIIAVSKQELSLLILIFALIILAFLVFQKKMDEERFKVLAFLYVLAGAASICVLVFSAMQPKRTWFIGIIFLIIAAAYLYGDLVMLPSVLPAVLAVVMVLAFSYSFQIEYRKIDATYMQVREGVQRIEQAVRQGKTSATIPMVKPSDSKYDAYNGTSYVKEPADDWMNAWMACYYGLEAIYGTEELVPGE